MATIIILSGKPYLLSMHNLDLTKIMSLKSSLHIVLMLVCVQSFAQLGIGTAMPNPSAQLDVVTADKGVLIPRVSLTSITDATTISSGNVESLLVYNTNTTVSLLPGYYYWANSRWNKIVTESEITALPKNVTSTNGSITGVANNAALAAMNLEVKVDNSSIEVNGVNGLQLKDAGITSAKIKENAVDGTKIQVTGEASGSMLYHNGTHWVDFPKGTAGQYLRMNAAGTAPQWTASKRIGEFVFAKSGLTVTEGYLPVTPGTVANGAVDYPLWAAKYPEFVSGDDIVFPADVAGMFLRNLGGTAAAEGVLQSDATARPNTPFTTASGTSSSDGAHTHQYSRTYRIETSGWYGRGTHSWTSVTVPFNGWSSKIRTAEGGDGSANGAIRLQGSSYNTDSKGNHTHTIPALSVTAGGDAETRPVNRAYQLYTIVDTY